ncbi:MAG TPA: cytochrome b/b6 domain-containing protein [Candidatus Paceibacterota bacterium]|nr:cytochrome b/b6 domain-containing protein [Verrucomicrobiota bacterium]HSA12782.1 cytochrome b/b6 domain-containing protein [Candidatus Paceibacterota bacterium]
MGFQRPRAILTALILFAFSGLTTAVSAAEPIKDNECLECHGDKTLTKTNAAGREVSLFVDAARIAASVHKTNTCASCHADITSKHPDDEVPAQPANCKRCHEQQSESYGASVHGLALAKGQTSSATCSDCHDGHSILPPTSIESPLHFSRLAETCGGCHDQEARDVEESVHGKAVAAGHREAPTCTDCHSEHKIKALKDDSSLKVTVEVCSQCHASERLNTKYNLPPDRVKTFFESYHGLATQYGSTLAANCASCHGVHKILPSTDPRSSIHKTNLVVTCGKCHPGATDKFVQSKVHVDTETTAVSGDIGEQISGWVRRIYLVLIVATIGLMLSHNLLLFAKKVRARYRAADLSVLRMSFSQRAQHLILAASFIVLAVTGFALKFPDSWIAKILGSNEMFRRWSHRVAGVVLLLVGAYHVIYLFGTREGRQLVKDLLPVGKDLKDVTDNARYLAGLSAAKPKFARFGYAEKVEYWAVVWGTIIMGVTGLVIWFKIDVTQVLPRWVVDVAVTIHYYEAILACLAILVWHFYHVIFDPDVYPLNWACWNGKVSKHWQEDEHPFDRTPTPDPPPIADQESTPGLPTADGGT